MTSIQLNAHAKINIGLDVLRRREDNYHEVRMVMQTIGLHDHITIEILPEDTILLETNTPSLPSGQENLAYRAAALIKKEYPITRGVKIFLEKHIPAAAGMAGGSSDCAAVLKGMNRLFHLSLDQQTLMDLGVRLGADVPYCILGKTALSEGIGELLTPLSCSFECAVLIAKPPIQVSTAHVYQQLDIPKLKKHPDIDGILAALRQNDIKAAAPLMENVLETVTAREYPVIETLKGIMMKNGALGALMSGSGPTVFGLFDSETAARAAKLACERQNSKNCVILTAMDHGSENFN